MNKFLELINEEKLSQEEIDQLCEDITWEDIYDLYEDDEIEDIEPVTLSEKISASSRMKRMQQMKQRKTKLMTARAMKLKRPSTTAVLSTRAKAAARRMLMKKMLKGRDKASLSAQERDNIEQRVKQMIANNPGLVMKSVQKVRGIERSRLSGVKK
jgi:hypothetical protein